MRFNQGSAGDSPVDSQYGLLTSWNIGFIDANRPRSLLADEATGPGEDRPLPGALFAIAKSNTVLDCCNSKFWIFLCDRAQVRVSSA